MCNLVATIYLVPLFGTQMWYAAPLIVAISLVYAATRHEQMWPILENAFRFAVWIVGFMIVLFAILTLVSWGL